MRISPLRFLVTLDGPEFDHLGGGDNFMRILVGMSSWETLMGFHIWTDAGVKSCQINRFFNT